MTRAERRLSQASAAGAGSNREGRRRLPFHVLRYRAYRRIWIGVSLSAAGTWLRQLTASILVLQATDSALLVGLVNFLGFLPILFLTLVGGHTVDRKSSRTVLIVSQAISGSGALALAILAFLDLATIPVLFTAVFVIGAAYAFTKPAVQALLPELVPPEALSDAVSVHSLQFTLGLAVGPGLAAVILHAFNPGVAFALDAASFLALLAAATTLPRRDPSRPTVSGPVSASMREALSFVGERPMLKVLLLAMSCSTVSIEVVKTLMPIFAVRSFDLRADSAGFLVAVFGVGSVIGAAAGPRLEAWRGVEACVAALWVLGATMIMFSHLTVVTTGAAALAVAGLAFMVSNVFITSAFFRAVPEGLRGRVFAIHTLSFLGVSPIAAVLSGTLAQLLSVAASGTITGAFALIAAAILWRHIPAMRQARSEEGEGAKGK